MSEQSEDLGRVLVIIPTYNELENIRLITGRVRKAMPEAHILIADDNSPDGTGAVADELVSLDDHIHVMHRLGKEGLAAAYMAGFSWGLEHGYGVLVEMDADGSHQPEQLPRLVAALQDADLVLGSRWVPGGAVENWPMRRKILSRGGNLYTRLMLDVDLKDATGGFRVFRATTLRALNLDSVASQGYCFQVDLARRVVAAGMKVVEVPITFVERAHGTSKMNNKIVAEALWRVTVWGTTERVGKARAALAKRRSERKQLAAEQVAADEALAEQGAVAEASAGGAIPAPPEESPGEIAAPESYQAELTATAPDDLLVAPPKVAPPAVSQASAMPAPARPQHSVVTQDVIPTPPARPLPVPEPVDPAPAPLPVPEPIDPAPAPAPLPPPSDPAPQLASEGPRGAHASQA